MPGAYTILFILIILVAISSYFIPAGLYDLDSEGAPIPVPTTRSTPIPRNHSRTLRAPIEGMYGVQDETGNVNAFNYGEL